MNIWCSDRYRDRLGKRWVCE